MANNDEFAVSKQFKKFVVVEFIEEKKHGVCAMEIICSSWLINNHITYWPSNLQSSSRIIKAVQDNITPNRSWKQLNIRILYETDSYEAAFQKVEILTYTSNAETNEDSLDEAPLKKSREKQLGFLSKKKKRSVSTDEEQDNEDYLFNQTEIPLFSSQSVIRDENNLSTSIAAIEKRFAVFEKKNFELLTSIQYDIKKINLKMSNIEKLLNSNLLHAVSVTQNTIPFLEWNCLPIQTEEELVILEHKLQDKDNLESLINYLTAVGGEDFKKMTSAIMGKLLSPKTSLLYSTYGKKGKKSFAALTSCQVVIAAVTRKYPDSNEKSIKVRIGSFLAQSSDRDGGRKRRHEKDDFRNENSQSMDNTFSEINKTF